MHNRKNVTINNICMKLNKATVRECQTVFFNKTQFHNEIRLLIVLHHWVNPKLLHNDAHSHL